MTLIEKKERLIQEEWENFHAVNNKGGMASCQNRPDTFTIMRRSQFTCWDEDLVDSWYNDLLRAKQQGRNLLSEKYAWMMESTAPHDFEVIKQHLRFPSVTAEEIIEMIVEIEVTWMKGYRECYPYLSAQNRYIESSEDTPYETSFETYLRGELHTYSLPTLKLYLRMINRLVSENKSLALEIMNAMVKEYGYKDIDDAEIQEKIRVTSKMAGRYNLQFPTIK